MKQDPRDAGQAGIKEWEEFRASYASAFVFVWLLDELKETLTDYADDLHSRFMSGWDIQEGLEIDPDEPEDQRGFPLPGVGGVESPDYPDELIWMDNWEAKQLYQQLFPHRDSTEDFAQVTAGLGAVALRSALESYAKAAGVFTGGSLPRVIEEYIAEKERSELIDSITMRWLFDCDATRHIIVHNRGIVDEGYLRSVQGTQFAIDEFRNVTSRDLHQFARAIWKAAAAIRLIQREQGA